MKSEAELWDLLRDSHDMPFGAARIALVEQLVRQADAGNYDGLRFATRMQATTSYVHGGEPGKAFVTFSWCRAAYDKHPDQFDRSDEHTLLWHFKYMVSGMTKFPEIPLERTYDVLEDMERRFRASGHGLQPVYHYRWLVAEHIGDPSAEDWYAKWSAAPRDELSDCLGCDPSSKVDHLTARGRDEEAVELAAPVLAGRLTCVEQPQSILTTLLMPYLRSGRLAEAADAHRRAYRRMRANLADLAQIADHVAFCAQTGNELRGLEIVERHLPWLERAPSPWATMWFSASAALLLRRVGELHPAVRVRPADPVLPLDLADELTADARALAARFDARNGTVEVSRLLEERLAATPLVEQLPLTPPRAADRVEEPEVVEVQALPEDPAELLTHAETLLRLQRRDAAEAAWRAFDVRWPEPEPALAARRVEGTALLSGEADRNASGGLFRQAAAGYHEAGDEPSALVAEARAVLSEAVAAADADKAGDGSDALLTELWAVTADRLVGLVERAEKIGDSHRAAIVRLLLVSALLEGERYEEMSATLDLITTDVTEDPLLLAMASARRAHYLLSLDRNMEAFESAAIAVGYYELHGEPPVIAIPAVAQGEALIRLDRFAEAATAFDRAVRVTRQRDVEAIARMGRARALLGAGDPLAAIDDLVEAVADHVAKGNVAMAAMLRLDLSGAYQATGQLLDAAEAAEAAVEAFDRLSAQGPADQARYRLSLIYRELDEPDQAIALLEQLADNFNSFDQLPARGQALEEAGQVLYQLDRDRTAAEHFGGAAESFRAAGLQLDELRTRRWRALSLRWAEDDDAATAALAEADQLAATLPDDEPAVVWERAMLDYDGARVHIGGGRAHEALARVGGAAASFRGIHAFGEALQAELLHGEILLRLDSPMEAEPLLRAVLGAAPHESQLRENAAWMLSEALERLGREDEAAAIRRENGLTGD